MFGRYGRTANHEQVDTGLDNCAIQLLSALRRESTGHGDAARPDLGESLVAVAESRGSDFYTGKLARISASRCVTSSGLIGSE